MENTTSKKDVNEFLDDVNTLRETNYKDFLMIKSMLSGILIGQNKKTF